MDIKPNSFKERLKIIQLSSSESKGLTVITGFLVVLLVVLLVVCKIKLDSLSLINEMNDTIDEINTNVQRLVILEITDQSNDDLIAEIDELLVTLYNQEVAVHEDVTVIQDGADCFDSIEIVETTWGFLQNQIVATRNKEGYEDTKLLDYGEKMYEMMGTVSSQASVHFEEVTDMIATLQWGIIIATGCIYLIWMIRIVKYIRIARNSGQLYEKAYRDVATGLFNRSKCEELFLDNTSYHPSSVIVIYDLNDLKKVNDSLGHLYGDGLIKDFADILLRARKRIDGWDEQTKPIIGRYGGDEFIVYFSQIESGLANQYMDMVDQISDEFNRDCQDYTITYARGQAYACEHEEVDRLIDLLSLADREMYARKISMKSRKGDS